LRRHEEDVSSILPLDGRYLDNKSEFTWNDREPLHTVKAQQKHILPPAPLSEDELDRAHKNYGQNIVTWCETSFGTVGDGEYWTLVETVLRELVQAYMMYGKEPPRSAKAVLIAFVYSPLLQAR
jgi:hypothetical protein